MSYRQLLELFLSRLEEVSNTPYLDFQILVEYATGINKTQQFIDKDFIIDEKSEKNLKQLLEKRCQHVPIAYLINCKEFWNYSFYVDSRVLIPRPETEVLVEQGLEFIKQHLKYKKEKLLVLDLGCGSGCIGLSLLKDLLTKEPRLEIVLTLLDNSSPALEVAETNTKRLDLNNNIEFLNSNWFEKVKKRYDLILCNPPYVDRFDKEIYPGARYEPDIALYAQDNGLQDLNYLVANYNKYLNPGGLFFCEIGLGQDKFFNDKYLRCIKDLSLRNRVLVFKKNW